MIVLLLFAETNRRCLAAVEDKSFDHPKSMVWLCSKQPVSGTAIEM